MDHDLVDAATDVANHVLHETSAPSQDGPLDACMAERGAIEGTNLAYADLAGLPVGSLQDSQASYEHSQAQALHDCKFDDYVDHGSAFIPSLTSPTAAFFDVVTHPSELNAGEDKQFAVEHIFGQAYDASYQETVAAQPPDHSGFSATPSFDTGASSSGGGGSSNPSADSGGGGSGSATGAASGADGGGP